MVHAHPRVQPPPRSGTIAPVREPAPGPFGELLGIQLLEREQGFARATIAADRRHLNPHGVVHGAAVYALVDQAMGAAVYSVMDPTESCATLEVSIAYLSPGRPGPMEATVRLVRRTRRIAVLEAEARQGDRLLAKALGTYAIFPVEPPTGESGESSQGENDSGS